MSKEITSKINGRIQVVSDETYDEAIKIPGFRHNHKVVNIIDKPIKLIPVIDKPKELKIKSKKQNG